MTSKIKNSDSPSQEEKEIYFIVLTPIEMCQKNDKDSKEINFKSKYKPLKTFLSEVNMPDLFINFAKKNIFTNEQIENLSDYDLQTININESDRKKMLEYVKELKMRRELSVEGDFGTRCDSKYYYNDPNPDNNEHLISDLLKKYNILEKIFSNNVESYLF